jgi:hypothetical protein
MGLLQQIARAAALAVMWSGAAAAQTAEEWAALRDPGEVRKRFGAALCAIDPRRPEGQSALYDIVHLIKMGRTEAAFGVPEIVIVNEGQCPLVLAAFGIGERYCSSPSGGTLAAFYHPPSRRIFVKAEQIGDPAVLAHEFVHYFQHRYESFDFNDPMQLAWTEGEASYIENLIIHARRGCTNWADRQSE